MRRGQVGEEGIKNLVAVVIVLLVLGVAIYLIWMSKKGAADTRSGFNFSECKAIAGLYGGAGTCMRSPVCNPDPGEVTFEIARGGKWRIMGDIGGCPTEEFLPDQTTCCIYISPETVGSSSVLNCRPEDPDFRICDDVPADQNGQHFTTHPDTGERVLCHISGGECVAVPAPEALNTGGP